VPPLLANLRTSAATGNLRRNPLYLIAFLLFFIYAADKLSDYVRNNDINGLAYVALVLVVGTSTIAMLNNWRNGLYFFIAWLLFEDLARKYLGNNMAIYFGKDFLVGIVYIAFFIAYRGKKVQSFRWPFRAPLLVFLWFCVMQIFNPASSGIFYGLMGFKLFFYYIPLMFIGYALIDTEKDLRRLFVVCLAIAALICSLGIAQANGPRWPYGYGLGTASLGAQYVARILHAPPMNIGIESGYGEIIMEIGIVGLILWVIMSFSIVFSAWRMVIKLRGSILFPIAFVIFWYAFLVLVPFTFNGLNTYQNFVMNAYLWLLIGVLYRLPTMKLMAQPAKVPVQAHTRHFGAL
jgi:hypothetical protein